MLLAIVVIVSVSSYVWGQWEINRMEELPIARNAEAQMLSIDNAVQSVAHGDVNFTTVMDLYYPKGIIQVEENNDWVKYTSQINANVYEGEASGVPCACSPSCTLVEDSVTSIKMSLIPYTRVYRGSTGDSSSQYVEVVACYDDIDLVVDPTCVGKSGPRAQLTLRKLGYDSATHKPQVMVRVC